MSVVLIGESNNFVFYGIFMQTYGAFSKLNVASIEVT